MAVIVVIERLISGAAGLTVILTVAVLLPLTLLAVIVYTTLVAALAGVPEIVPSVVSKDRLLAIAGDIEYVASPPVICNCYIANGCSGSSSNSSC